MLELLVHHIALPPQLPQQQQRHVLNDIQNALVDRLLAATNTLTSLDSVLWNCIRRSIQSCKSINSGGTINKTALLAAFRGLDNGSDEVLILHVAEQNAAVLIRRDSIKRDNVIFEAFEASPLSEAVLAAKGPLEWDFPGCAVTIPISTFSNHTFQNELAVFLSQASTESIKRFAAKTNKAGVFVFESRDTVDPALITSMLMTLLEANGARSFPSILRKRVRDDVCWSEGAEKPWRRCPFWLVVRVAIQRHLSTILGGETGRLQYKFLICQVLAELLEEGSRKGLDIELLSFLNSKLCRRIAKLQVDKQRAHTKIQMVYESMFLTLQPFFEKATTIAVSQIETAWAGFKKNNLRPISSFPRRSEPRHLQLSLPNSASYIDGILSASMYGHQRHQPTTARTQPIPGFSSAINGERKAFADRYSSLSEFEINMEQTSAEPTPTSEADCEERCISLAENIEDYLVAVGNAYDGNPEQKSTMLLTIMELWVSMEKCAIKLFVLLRDFDPVFPTEILDVLHISSPKDMRRLQNIRSYLKDSPIRGCFGERYFEESEGSLEMKDLYRQIEDRAEEERQNKEQEWQSKSADYERLVRAAAENFNSDSNGPSSYTTVASQSRCPPGVNVHEFMAYQALFSGKTRRWPQILMELGASNLNFSTEATALLLCHLALQIGPSPDDSHLGSVHAFFNDGIFCANLLNQLSLRLDGISSNWRETNCMEAIITLTIRLNSLGTGSKNASKQLLEKVRYVTFKWITELRSEVRATTDLQTSLSLSTYALWAALLCRRTFDPCLDFNHNLDAQALQCYIESSITMQDNMASDVVSLPILLRFSLVRDLKMIYRMRYLLRKSLLDNPQSFVYAIKTVWPNVDGAASEKLSPFQFLEGAEQWWVTVTMEATHHTLPQTVHFHVLEGHLLVDGKPIGKLPAKYTTHIILTELFDNQNLSSYPSNLPGMNYTLTVVPYGHQIHLGFRNDHLVVRAIQGNRILELLPRQIFSGAQNFDLPASLVDTCVHWLDIRTGIIEIRQRPQIWNTKKPSNWTLDYPKRRAKRRESTLIDPNSPLFKLFSRTFEFFEDSRFLTVVLPGSPSSALVVELRRLELVFFVNDRNCLESSQLRAEIDLDQDAGTWYGLQSKIVLREKIQGHNYHIRRRQRSIIVPMGNLIQYKRHGIHIATRVESSGGFYGRYTINQPLGRLDCPAEPRLLYFKALCHAYTSFILPDSLTGRTGTEEALHCLAGDLAGILQSWPKIGGYKGEAEKILLSNLLSLNFAPEWGSFVNLCRNSSSDDQYRLMFLFSVISFRQDADMDAIRTLLAFAIIEDLKGLTPPTWPLYEDFKQNQVPRMDDIQQLMKRSLVPYKGDELYNLEFELSAKLRKKYKALERAHEQQQEVDMRQLGDFLLKQWPCPAPSIEGFTASVLLLNIAQALDAIRPEWLRLFQNFELSLHISQVQEVLDRHYTDDKGRMPQAEVQEQAIYSIRYRGGEFPTLSQLLSKIGPTLPVIARTGQAKAPKKEGSLPKDYGKTTNRSSRSSGAGNMHLKESSDEHNTPEGQELQAIIEHVVSSESNVRQQYGKDLTQSLKALGSLRSESKNQSIPSAMTLADQISTAQKTVSQHFTRLSNSFEEGDSCAHWLRRGGLWPVITPISVLETLRSTLQVSFGTNMKESIVQYALSITKVQQLIRMEEALLNTNHQRLIEEQNNLPHSNWAPIDRKTSCIMPMAAAVLGDRKKLLRVVVPKALLLQTAQLLHARLGGLLGRELRHIPFSRKTSTDEGTIQLFDQIHKDLQESCGVILALPEHLLSFKLSGLQRLSDGLIPEAKKMVKVQSYLDRVSRDILDEADYILAIRTQLIYPSGSQKTVDGHPHRWETIEALLKLVESNFFNLRKRFPQSIEVVQSTQGRFPVVYFLRKDVEDALIFRLVDEIYRGRTLLLPEDLTMSDRVAIKQFISEPKVSQEVLQHINHLSPEKPAVKQVRWNVQYGLHPERDPIAVPYHAKGTPSDQAEWGHPDVAILFTCLAFYHGGLNVDSLRDWGSINIDDEAQILEIWTHVRYQVIVVDYFLNNFVFPRHAKQFQLKLQASGWDIPLFSPQSPATAVEKSCAGSSLQLPLTTGFSGTNDSKRMLPLTIKQQDLSGLAHTNAEVLTYLLQQRNRQYALAADHQGKRLSERGLLQRISNMNIRVFIDAGAQILEMDNYTLAKTWLDIFNQAPAAVYFRDNKPIVLYRHGRQVPLLATPYADDLGEALVYLDQAHTRGTDLKMPARAAGALTLGLDQSKDHTVQAAMRLRQLGTTQSVVWFAPPEVHQSILDVRQKKSGDSINSHDVVHWLLEQTCVQIEQLQPLYISQGNDFCRRAQAALQNAEFLIDEEQRKSYLATLRQYEQQTLEQLYGVNQKVKQPASSASKVSGALAAFDKELKFQRKSFQDSGHAVHGSALQEVEQEREVAFEVENVREVQKPVHFQPFAFPSLHRDLVSFVKTGRMAADSAAYEDAFKLLRRTSVGRKHRVSSDGTAFKLYVSTEFTKTVKFPTDRSFDNFQRQPNWILWSTISETALVIIPEEAEHIIPLLFDVKDPPTYLLTYAAPVTRKMLLHFNDLKFYSIPNLPSDWEAPLWLKVELGLFAGRLYFDYSEYATLCKFLGVKESAASLEEIDDDFELGPPALDGVVEEVAAKSQAVFARKPLTFLHEWLAIRRKGQDFASSPMGQVCQGKPLTSDHTFFMKPEAARTSKDTEHKSVRRSVPVNAPEEDDAEDDIYDENAFGKIRPDEIDTFDDAALKDDSSEEEESD
ncbi:hypothetical protein LAWI1_G000351 [Lachnellula willkommii]|uniref:ubiquitinyl hydrolase 1 n=1 Tax=Lachnellula willkommii TaxID=215461 RepID=A0A559MN22_9HELO|nr:hypothetical protein LAWI1_G000351 [Lachnellula willkommii]